MTVEVIKTIKIHIGPVISEVDGGARLSVSMERVNPNHHIQSTEIVEILNDPLTVRGIREDVGCATCKAARYIETSPDNELDFRAYLENKQGGGKNIVVELGCPVLTYANKNGFLQDCECTKITSPVLVSVGSTYEKRSLKENLKWFGDFLHRLFN